MTDDKHGAGGPPSGRRPPMADIDWVKNKHLDIPYGSDSSAQVLDLYLPQEGEVPFPLLVHIHGGGFAMGDKRDDHMNGYLKGLRHGFALASVGYRLSGEAIFPAAVLDCRQAIRYLRENAKKLNVNPEKICVIGGSAGGNLAAMMAMNIEVFPGEEGGAFAIEPKVVAVVDQFGPMNFKTMDDQARENGVSVADHDAATSPESRYIGITIGEANAGQCAPANPLTYASWRMCPILVQHGTMDKLVPYGQSVEFVEGLRAKGLGTKVRLTSLEGADHDDKMFFTDENLDLVFSFLKAQL